jgi:hypothetical protein
LFGDKSDGTRHAESVHRHPGLIGACYSDGWIPVQEQAGVVRLISGTWMIVGDNGTTYQPTTTLSATFQRSGLKVFLRWYTPELCKRGDAALYRDDFRSLTPPPNDLRTTTNNYEQVDAIIRTLSTLSVGAFAAEAGGFCSVRDGCSIVPVISTLCPTCVVSFASSESSRYSLEMAVVEGAAVPVVPVVSLVFTLAFVSTNFVSGVAVSAPVVPVVAACS